MFSVVNILEHAGDVVRGRCIIDTEAVLPNNKWDLGVHILFD